MNKIKQFFKCFKEGLSLFGHNISLIVNSILLSLVYLIGIGFTSFFARIFGKHFLELKTSKKAKTYWSNLNLKTEKIDNYYRQF